MVDDEPINMSVLQLHLKTEGYRNFVTVSDSKKACDVICSERPDVLLLDLNMPEVSGLDILERVRADDEMKQLPVIVLTSSSNPDAKLMALQLGATDFLSKPVDASELALRMRNTLIARAYERRLMHFDSLTNLPNRLYFSEKVQDLRETGNLAKYPHSLTLINLSRFKSINDTFGNDRGDDLLWAFSQRLCGIFESIGNQESKPGVTQTDCLQMLARLGGDRFAMLLLLDQSAGTDVVLHEKINAIAGTVEVPFVVDSQNIFLSVEMGVSILDHETASVETLINEAETAMNQVQKLQGVCYTFFSSEMLSAERKRVKIENSLRTCLVNEELSLLFQPKVCCRTDSITGAEALVRWEHPELGMVSPVDFIPVAESSGMIVSIGLWVLKTACAETLNIRMNGHPDFKIAVNVSIRQLYESDFIESVRDVLQQTQLPPEALMIELTENMIIENVESSILKIANLRELGIQVSIDDFGTGYSSLSYLQRFPINQLKIDRSFIMQIDSIESRAPIVRAVVSLAHDLELTVVAEGVEDSVQRDFVALLGCEEYQGYLKSRPIKPMELFCLLQDNMRQCA